MPRRPATLTDEEKAAIAAYDGEVQTCPAGGHEPTWRPGFGRNLVAVTSDTGAKSPARSSRT